MSLEAVVQRQEEAQVPLGVPEILGLLPHRYPMLFVDRIDHLEPGRYAEGVKCVTANEPFLAGHFPDYPIMPGVFIVEALAQLAGVMLRSSSAPKRPIPAEAIQKVRFLRPVLPGDQLQLRVTLIKSLGSVHQVKVEALVRGQAAATGELVLAS
jgi:3-hydroxyacyl-[acyl-carrier-protein] dehydratase